MKKNTASQKRYERLYKLIGACLEHFSEEEMIEVFNKLADENYEIEKTEDDFIFELGVAGYTVIKAESLAEQIKVESFVNDLKENPYQLKLIAC